MSEGMIKKAITRLETKYIPQLSSTLFSPQEQYKFIMPLLDVWGSSYEDEKVEEKVKFIYDKLVEENKDRPQDSLISLLTTLGAVKFGESKLDKVYKYFNLQKESEKALKYHYLISDEINNLVNKKDDL